MALRAGPRMLDKSIPPIPGRPRVELSALGLTPASPARLTCEDSDMATDEDEDEDANGDAASNASFYTGYELDESQDEDAQGETEDLEDLQSAFGGHEHKRSRTSSSSSYRPGTRHPRKNGSGHVRYDSQTDQQAAAMFSPLSLLTGQNTTQSVYQQQFNNNSNNNNNGGSNILVPTVANSTSPNSQATASAATLAAIQAAAAANGINTGSTPTGRIWIPNNAKPFKCPVPGCDKAYKQQNGLKYHRLHGHCNSNSNGKEGEGEVILNEEDKPFGCYVGPACGKKYKNMNGLRYHYQHSGAHGQIGLQMLSNGTHPPPAYPPGHKRSSNNKAATYSEYSNTASPTVVMNQSTAEALLAAIQPQNNANPTSSGHSSRNNSRPATPRIGTPSSSRGPSPSRHRTSPQRQASMSSFSTLPMGMGVAMDDY